MLLKDVRRELDSQLDFFSQSVFGCLYQERTQCRASYEPTSLKPVLLSHLFAEFLKNFPIKSGC